MDSTLIKTILIHYVHMRDRKHRVGKATEELMPTHTPAPGVVWLHDHVIQIFRGSDIMVRIRHKLNQI
jgi:hypothetical protein